MTNIVRAGVAVAAALWLAAGTAHAQGNAAAYVFGAPGQVRAFDNSATTFHAGGGGEYLIGGVVGLGAEIGYLAATRNLGEGAGVFSTNGSVHFGRTGTVIPYVTAGYSVLFEGLDDTIEAFNVGAGVTCWFARRAGLRLELRDHVRSAGGTTFHWWGFRFGVTLR